MLYIANTTKQNWNHHFRVPESNRPFFFQIPSGGQIVVGHGWTNSQQEAVIHQLEKYGARKASEISGALSKFPGLLYRTDKPITESQIIHGHEALVDAQERRSASEASRSAMAFDTVTREKKGRGKRLAKVTEVSVDQETPRGQKPDTNEVHFSLGVTENGASNFKVPE